MQIERPSGPVKFLVDKKGVSVSKAKPTPSKKVKTIRKLFEKIK